MLGNSVVFPSEVALNMDAFEAGRIDQLVPLIARQKPVGGVTASDFGDHAGEEEGEEQQRAVFDADFHCLAH